VPSLPSKNREIDRVAFLIIPCSFLGAPTISFPSHIRQQDLSLEILLYLLPIHCPKTSIAHPAFSIPRHQTQLTKTSGPVMPGGSAMPLAATADVNRIEAPVTFKAYLICAFAAFGGIFFGFDSSSINGVMAMKYFVHTFSGLPYPPADARLAELAAFNIPAPHQSLIVSIPSAGTFFT
jgi:hypothetical protein